MKKQVKKLYETTKKSIDNCDLKIHKIKQDIINNNPVHIEYILNDLLQLQKDKCYLESSLRNIKTMYFELKEYK